MIILLLDLKYSWGYICTKSSGTKILNFEKSLIEEVCNELKKIDGDAAIVPKNVLWENGGNVLGTDKKDAIYVLSNKI